MITLKDILNLTPGRCDELEYMDDDSYTVFRYLWRNTAHRFSNLYAEFENESVRAAFLDGGVAAAYAHAAFLAAERHTRVAERNTPKEIARDKTDQP